MPKVITVDRDQLLAHITQNGPCSLGAISLAVLGWAGGPCKALLIALHDLERAGKIKVTPFKHGTHTRRLYEVRP